ncbi:MAG: DegV family protein [Ruminococcus sp.]|nr:DegV family protein [Ruminococcus sp.]
MNKIRIFTDSCSDLTKDLREKYDIEYLKMNTIFNGEEKVANLDWTEYSPKEFYDIMRDGGRITTTQVPEQEFRTVFTNVLEEGDDIVYIGCSSKLSGSVEMGKVVSKDLLKNYPDRKIYCINSLNACMGEGLVAIKASQFRAEGMNIDEIAEKISEIRNTVNQYVTVHSLDALKRAGRVKATSAFFGNLLGVKPIIISNPEGDNVPVKKAKGRFNSMQEIVNLMAENIIEPENQCVYIVHADSEEDALELEKLVKEKIPTVDTHMGYIGPIIGASIGPEALGIFAFGKNIEHFGV